MKEEYIIRIYNSNEEIIEYRIVAIDLWHAVGEAIDKYNDSGLAGSIIRLQTFEKNLKRG